MLDRLSASVTHIHALRRRVTVQLHISSDSQTTLVKNNTCALRCGRYIFLLGLLSSIPLRSHSQSLAMYLWMFVLFPHISARCCSDVCDFGSATVSIVARIHRTYSQLNSNSMGHKQMINYVCTWSISLLRYKHTTKTRSS